VTPQWASIQQGSHWPVGSVYVGVLLLLLLLLPVLVVQSP